MGIPEFTEKGKRNKDIFYRAYNDITIFVEDEKLEHFYTDLFSRLLKGSFNIKRVISLGGKDPVIKQFKKYKEGDIDIKNPIFLLDRDLDPFLGIPFIDDDTFIYLKDYCIENYLINEYAFCYSVSWQLQVRTDDLIENALFKHWEDNTIDRFLDLFIAFILCRKYNLGENAEQSPYCFVEDKGYTPDLDKINSYIENISSIYIEKLDRTKEDFIEELHLLKVNILKLTHNNKQTIISGKYLFASLYKYTQHLCAINKKSTKLDKNWFLALLTEKIEMDRLLFIRERAIELYAS